MHIYSHSQHLLCVQDTQEGDGEAERSVESKNPFMF